MPTKSNDALGQQYIANHPDNPVPGVRACRLLAVHTDAPSQRWRNFPLAKLSPLKLSPGEPPPPRL